MKTKTYLVKFVNYTKLDAAFKTRKAAILYMNKMWETYGMHVYMDGEIIKVIK